MAVALHQEWPTGRQNSTEMYDAVTVKMDIHNSPPDGLIVHTAGYDSDGTWRIYDVWQSKEAAEKFQQERLWPALQEVGQQQAGGMQQPTKMDFYELHDVVHP